MDNLAYWAYSVEKNSSLSPSKQSTTEWLKCEMKEAVTRASMKKHRVILISDYVAPFRLPLFERLYQSSLVDLQVYFLSQSAANRRWKAEVNGEFNYKVLPKIELNLRGRDLFYYRVNPTFPFRLVRERYDLLITHGWFESACQAGFLVSKAIGKPYIIYSESTMYEPSWLREISLPLVRFIVKHSDACIATGKRARDYFIYLGADERKIFTANLTVDVDHFRRVGRLAKKDKCRMKQSLGIKTEKVILYVGRLTERKGVRHLVEAYRQLRKDYRDVSLLILGYGYQEQGLKELCRSQSIPDVYFVDHVETDKMPRFYGIADLFVLPSRRDTWGLVLNEAMACGLPVITTRKVGASEDLVREGVNGYIVAEEKPAEMYAAMKRMVVDSSLCHRMGQESSRIIQRFSIDNEANGFLSAIEYVMSQSKEGRRVTKHPPKK